MATVDVNRHDYFPANSDIQVFHTDYMMKNWLITSYTKIRLNSVTFIIKLITVIGKN